ncbi:sensor domain-containing diguanylate cyclase [Acanthopleuribacter pedis]|uniref:diguanylate cyclase n=1 Tax=Acanthopleuribacter pedis TaxID=442870 RepID=A0A8J7U826_9BACT|nr:sensor domain-containing diguanylate cyclase [Acanthopleuribacter pedis]MBO1322041.1 sensor domain-containing diguanylate cyclase [Acanthopleuribacter pedis]
MKHGPILLVTDSKYLLAKNITGVLSSAEFSPHHLTTSSATLIDMRLSDEKREEIQAICLGHCHPFFSYALPTRPLDELRREQHEVTLNFLHFHNEAEKVPPSQETIDKIHLKTLIDIITTTNSLLQPEDVMQTVMTRIHELITCEAWSVLILDENQPDTLRFAAASGPTSDQLRDQHIQFGKGIAGWVAKHRQPLIVNQAQEDPRFLNQIDKDTNFRTRNILCAPLISRGRTLGVIEMLNRDDNDGFTENDLELVQILVNPAAVAIENAFLFQKAQTLTIQDDLTKLYNSRHLNQCLSTEIKRARRLNRPLSLVFLDLDGFKAVNDKFGHLQGSQSLIDIAKIINECARDTDIAGRWGGDEFMLILPTTDTEGAVIVSERIRDRIEKYRVHDLSMSASIGIASFPNHGHHKEELMQLADKAMYRVKESGKNGILVAGDL